MFIDVLVNLVFVVKRLQVFHFPRVSIFDERLTNCFSVTFQTFKVLYGIQDVKRKKKYSILITKNC
jgi:hypothetical protein